MSKVVGGVRVVARTAGIKLVLCVSESGCMYMYLLFMYMCI
jgi:hypothetical protein